MKMNKDKKQLDKSDILINIGLGLILIVIFIKMIQSVDWKDISYLIPIVGLILIIVGVLMKKSNKYTRQSKEKSSNK